MKVLKEENAKPIKAWVGAIDDIDALALTQLKNLARMPFIAQNGVAVMPDVHAGKGSTVGSVIATQKAIIPAAVGVDIGCGMVAVRTSLRASDLPQSLSAIRAQIERDIPLGNAKHQRDDLVSNHWMARGELLGQINELLKKHPQLEQRDSAYLGQLGSLGSGNHFIELCLDENQDVWVMLHSGSRGFGNKIGSHFIEKAKEEMERYFVKLSDPDLAFLPEGTQVFDDYVNALSIAQDYAMQNRKQMLELTVAALRRHIPVEFTLTEEAINCHHNYTARENHFGQNLWITRKGAIQAREGSLGIIPGSMGQKSYIVRGKGNSESYCSCSHGAGRLFSRTKARQLFKVDDLVEQTQGVECRKDDAVLDELPSAYKPIDQVMANQTDLVDVVHTLKAVLCVKGT